MKIQGMNPMTKQARTAKNEDRGQAMILFAVALIGLLAFVALVVDTGQLYSERRNAQSAADSTALAAASAYVQVIIASKVDTAFLHLFGRKRIVNTSSAIVHVQTDDPAFGDDALVSTIEDSCDAFKNKGNISIKVLIGNILINSVEEGSDTTCGFYVNANSGNVTLSDGTIWTAGTGIQDKHSVVSLPTGTSVATGQAVVDCSKQLPAPRCDL
jgi:hypothetical protein